MIDGFSIRSKDTSAGGRQILSVHIVGDVPDLQSLHLHVMDHDFRALSACTLGIIPHDALRTLTRSRTLVAEAMWRETLVDAAIFRECIVNLGTRPARERLAHLVLELRHRLAAVGRASDEQFDLPMTQNDLAEALGLTAVHVNRVLKALRHDGILEIRSKVVTVRDAQRLAGLAEFDDLYLHQRPEL